MPISTINSQAASSGGATGERRKLALIPQTARQPSQKQPLSTTVYMNFQTPYTHVLFFRGC